MKRGSLVKMSLLLFLLLMLTAMNSKAVLAYSDEAMKGGEYAVVLHQENLKMSLNEIKLELWELFGDEKIVEECILYAYDMTGDRFFSAKGSGKGGMLPKMSFLEIEDQEYTGKAIKPAIRITDGGYMLVNGKDFSVSYLKNTKVGIAAAVVKGRGSYQGSKKVLFKIVPAAVKISSVAYDTSKGVYTVKWKQSKGVNGYKVYYAPSQNGEYKLLANVSGKKTSFTTSKLKKGVMYFFKVAAFKNVNHNVFLGAMSEAKYDAKAYGDDPVVTELNGDSSIERMYFKSCERVGGKAFLSWKSPSDKNVSKLQILREADHSGIYVVVCETTKLEQNLFIDTKINSKSSYTYYIRCFVNGKNGNAGSYQLEDAKDVIRWYKNDKGYIRVDYEYLEYDGAAPYFIVFDEKNSIEWNCDWSGYEYNSQKELDGYSNTYQYVISPPGGYYDDQPTVYFNADEKEFEYMWTQDKDVDGERKETGFIVKAGRV